MSLVFQAISKTCGFLLIFLMFPAYASDVYFLTRDGDRIELSTPLKNTLSTKIISKNNRIESKDMPSAYFFPLGTFIMSGDEYSFCLFHVQSKKTGYYYNFTQILPRNRHSLLHQMRMLLDQARKLNQADRERLKELFSHLSF